MDWRNITIGQALRETAQTWGCREAVASKAGRLNYFELYDFACRLAVGLEKIGVKKGDPVATIFGTDLEWVFVKYALHIIGAWLVPINVSFRAREVEFVLKQAHVKTLIAVDKLRQGNYLDILAEIDPQIAKSGKKRIQSSILTGLERIVTFSPESKKYAFTYDYHDVLASGSGYFPEQIDSMLAATTHDDICNIMFTSGSTGFPKGVMHNHTSLLGIGYNLFVKSFDLKPEHRILNFGPFFHMAGCVYYVLGALTSSCFMYINEFIPDEVIPLIEKERINLISGFDAHFNRLACHSQFAATDLGSIKFIMLGTGPEWYDRIKTLFPSVEIIGTHYGFTEGTGVSVWPDEKDETVRKYSNGKPWPGIDIKVVDPETGETLAADVPGEICLRGWSRFQGYYRDPEETKKAIDADGYFHSGDYGSMDSKGHLYFRGRYKMMIKTGGENVSEREVEVFLESMPGVSSVNVIGIPDRKWGEIVTAVIQEDKPLILSEAEVITFCQGKIANFKVPKKVLFLRGASWPLLGSGKIDKQTLKQQVLEKYDNLSRGTED